MARGLLTVPAGDNVVRLLPPLIIGQAEIDEALRDPRGGLPGARRAGGGPMSAAGRGISSTSTSSTRGTLRAILDLAGELKANGSAHERAPRSPARPWR